MSRPGRAPPAGTEPEAPLEKQVVRLPDGRELTYYRFPEPGPPPPAAAGGGTLPREEG